MQENKTLTLPISKKTVIIKGYVSGLIDQEVRKITANANKTSYEAPMDQVNVDNPDVKNMPTGSKVLVSVDPTAQIQADQKLLELMLVSVDGNNGAGLIDTLLALPTQDVNYVLSEIKQLQADGVVSDPKGAS